MFTWDGDAPNGVEPLGSEPQPLEAAEVASRRRVGESPRKAPRITVYQRGMVRRMSAVEIASFGVATVALVAATGLALALARTRQRLVQLQQAVERNLQSADVQHDLPARPVEEPSLPAVQTTAVAAPTPQQVIGVTMGSSLVRVAALSYGLRRALRAEHRDRVSALMRRELRRRRKIRQRAAKRASRSAPVRHTHTAVGHGGTPA